MIILICAGWYRNGMVRRELSHSKCAGSGFPYRIARSRILLSKPWPSTSCSVHYPFLFLSHALDHPA